MSGKIIEVVIFKTKKEVGDKQLIALSNAFGTVLEERFSEVKKRLLTRDYQNNRWVELIWWSSMEAAQAALEKIYQMDEFKQYCAALADDGSEMFYLEERV